MLKKTNNWIITIIILIAIAIFLKPQDLFVITGLETMTRTETSTVPPNSQITITYTAIDATGDWGATILETPAGNCDSLPNIVWLHETNQPDTHQVTLNILGEGTCTINGNYQFGSTTITAFPEAIITITSAPLTHPTDLEIINTVPYRQLLGLVSPNSINSEGAANGNQGGYVAILDQRAAENFVMKGLVENNDALLELGVKAIEYGFAHQDPDGSFQYDPAILNQGVTQEDLLEASAFFMQAVGHSYLLLQQAGQQTHLDRLNLLTPQMQLTMQHLTTNKEALKLKAANAPNRLAFDALAFKLNGIILNDAALKSVAQEFIQDDLATQTTEGYFLEHGGSDSSYQGTNLLKLQQYYVYATSSEKAVLGPAIYAGIAWEKTKILPNGEIDTTDNTRTGSCQETFQGQCKEVNYAEVAQAFIYYGEIWNDQESRDLSLQIIQYATAPTQPTISGGGGGGGGGGGITTLCRDAGGNYSYNLSTCICPNQKKWNSTTKQCTRTTTTTTTTSQLGKTPNLLPYAVLVIIIIILYSFKKKRKP